MAVYTRDLIWQKLSVDYGVTSATHTVDDVLEVWQEVNGLTDGQDLGAFYTTQTGISNQGDAEYKYWNDYTVGTFTPASITTQGWWDASDSSTITLTTGKVSQWNDKSGNARHATQATAGNRPIVATAQQNGKDALRFYADSTADWLAAGTTSTWKFLHDGTAKNLVMIAWEPFETDSGNVSSVAVCTTNVTSGSVGVDFRYTAQTGSDRHVFYMPNNSSTSAGYPIVVTNITSGDPYLTNPYVYSALFDATATSSSRAFCYINNSNAAGNGATRTGVPSTANSTLPLYIGCSISSQSPCRGYIYEVIIVSGAAATEANRLRLQGYLNQKWAIY